ncbi:hypothetical protein OROMI_033631 [Orobanche minor]
MSLISQNAVPKDIVQKKKKSSKKDNIMLVEEVKAVGLDAEGNQNRKQGREENDELTEIEQEKEMQRVQSSIFGSLYNPVEFGKDDEEEEEAKEEWDINNSPALFFTDKSANSVLSVYEEDMDARQEIDEKLGNNQLKPVWVDDEEEETKINIAKNNKLRKLRNEEDESVISGSTYVSRLRAQHIKMNPGTDWARPDFQMMDHSSDDEDSDGYKRTKLLPGLLEYSRLVDANVKDPSKAAVKSVQFHKNSQLLLVGGLDKTLRFFQVDGTLKMNGTVRSLAFTNDGQKLLSSGGDGKIYHWDMRTRTCFHIGVDEGCLNGTSLCTSPVGNLFAAGSDSEIVNVYNGDDFLGGKRKPIKAIENLTTKVDFMKFNSDAQILAVGSRMKKNSMKMIHVPTCTVFSNWPTSNQSLRSPSCVDFSPHGGLIAMGNAAGKVLLYKLHHYHQAYYV